MVTVRCIYPVIAPVRETKELQEKGGISISLAPGTFQGSKAVEKASQEVQATMGESVPTSMSTGGNGRFYKLIETTSNPVYRVNPEKVAFRVKINKQIRGFLGVQEPFFFIILLARIRQ